MTCIEFESVLQTCLDRGVFDEVVDELREHRETCGACRENWDQARLLADAIVVWREQTPEVDLVDATLSAHFASQAAPQAIESIPAVRPAAPRSRPAAAIAALASLAALVVVSVLLARRDASAPPSIAVTRTTEGHTGPAVDPASEDREERPVLLDQADATYGNLARTAAGAIEEFAWMMKPAPAIPPAADEAPATPRSWIDGMQRQLRPIGRSVGDTFDFLWEVGRPPDDNRT